MPHLSRRTKIIVIFVVILVLGSGLFALFQAQSQVPSDFTTARTQGAIIAQNIVTLSDQSTADLEKVNEYDKVGDYTDALTLTTTIANQSQQLRDQAVQLSNQVSSMTEALSSISSFPAQQAALESISSRLALISQLVNYSGDLGKLLDVLRNHFTGKTQDTAQVQTLVNQINSDVNAINNYNAQANASMNTFDKLTGQ
jgi:DNA repair ATPase RecN